jgi:low affinity Fe/Cu permease
VSAGKNFFVGVEHLTDPEIERLRKMIEDRVRKGREKDAGDIAVQVVGKEAGEAADRAGS